MARKPDQFDDTPFWARDDISEATKELMYAARDRREEAMREHEAEIAQLAKAEEEQRRLNAEKAASLDRELNKFFPNGDPRGDPIETMMVGGRVIADSCSRAWKACARLLRGGHETTGEEQAPSAQSQPSREKGAGGPGPQAGA